MAHVCYKANSDVCHTAAILDAAHGNIQQPAHNLIAVYITTLINDTRKRYCFSSSFQRQA